MGVCEIIVTCVANKYKNLSASTLHNDEKYNDLLLTSMAGLHVDLHDNWLLNGDKMVISVHTKGI